MHRPTYAEITSTLALFLALGGVSYAAATLPANSVTSSTIRNGQVRSADLAGGAVSASKLSKTLRSQLGVTAGGKGSDGSNGADGKNGSTGPQGATGPAGAAGRDGAAIAAHASFGDHDVSGTSFVKVGTMTWTQPAGAIDDIRGLYTALKDGSCNNGAGGAAYRLMVDGTEVSYDWGNQSGTDTNLTYDPDARITPPWSGHHPSSDRGVFGAELPIIGGAQPTTHTLELFLRREGCAQPVRLRGVEIYVTRFLPAG